MKKQASSFSLSPENIEYIDEQWKDKGKRNRSHWLDDLITHLREKSGKKPPTKLPVEQMQYPVELNVDAWNEWKAYRKEARLKAYKPTPRSEGAAIKNLIKLSKGDHQTQMLIVQQSIANGYQGLFEVKANETNQQINAQSSRKPTAQEQRDAELLAKYGNSTSHGGWPDNQPAYNGVDQCQVQRGIYEPMEQEGFTIDLDSGDFSSHD